MAAEDYYDVGGFYDDSYDYDDISNDQESWDHKHKNCSGYPVTRQNTITKEYFYGCSKFPVCKLPVNI